MAIHQGYNYSHKKTEVNCCIFPLCLVYLYVKVKLMYEGKSGLPDTGTEDRDGKAADGMGLMSDDDGDKAARERV